MFRLITRLVMVFALGLPTLVYAVSGVSGTIETTTWTKANSPYHITGTIAVPEGDTLTIEPGVDVLFDANVRFGVGGALFAEGTVVDSIRFLRGDVTEWGGIRVDGPEIPMALKSATSVTYPENLRLKYVRVSGAHGTEDTDGGISVAYVTAVLEHCVISGNRGDGDGGGVSFGLAHGIVRYCRITDNSCNYAGGGLKFGGATGLVEHCEILRNRAGYIGAPPYNGAAAIKLSEGEVLVNNCIIADNWSSQRSAVVDAFNHSIVQFENCTFYGNEAADYGSILYAHDNSEAYFNNCIIWGNPGSDFAYTDSDIVEVTWSLVDESWPGANNIIGDPMFVDAANYDFRLKPGSPCIDAGDPASPLDPDGTRADMGAMSTSPGVVLTGVALPDVIASPGSIVFVRILTALKTIGSGDFVFIADSAVLEPDTEFLRSHVFEDQPGALVGVSVRGDTVTVALAGMTPVTPDSVLVVLAFRVKDDAPAGDIALTWVPFPRTNVEEAEVSLRDGRVLVHQFALGDVSGDGTVSSADASLILKYVVRKIQSIDAWAADVTGNGYVTSFDARHVLMRVLDPLHQFPVEGGLLMRVATFDPVMISWERDGDDWVLRCGNPDQFHDLHMTVSLASDATVTVSGESGVAIASRQDGVLLDIAAARTDRVNRDLLRVIGSTASPVIEMSEACEGWQMVSVQRPGEIATLQQNRPNPFNPNTDITYNLTRSAEMSLVIHNVAGQIVRTLASGLMSAGQHTVAWDGRDTFGRHLGSGVYIYRLTAEGKTITRRMTFVR